MNNLIKKVILYTILTIVLAVIGFLVYKSFIDISFSQLEKRNVQLISTSVGMQFKSHVIFALSIGIIPLLYIIANKYSNLRSNKQIITTLGLILGSGILNWQLRIVQLNYVFLNLSKFNNHNGFQNSLDIKKLNFSMYVLIGFLAGTLLSILIFRFKNQSITK